MGAATLVVMSPDLSALGRRLTRHPLLAGALLALVLFPVALAGTGAANPGPVDTPYVLWAAAFVLPLVVAVSRPRTALLLLVPAVAAQLLVADEPMAADVTVLLVLGILAARHPPRVSRWWTGGVLVLALVAALDWTNRAPPAPAPTPAERVLTGGSLYAVCAGLILAAVLAGATVRLLQEQADSWRRLSQAQERDRLRIAELAAAQERARIARDLHDVVAHSLTVIAVQADGAGYLLRGRAEAALTPAVTALDTIRDTARGALAETRHLVRAGPEEPSEETAGRGVQPGLADLPALVRTFDPGGRRITLTGPDEDGAGAPSQLQLAAYRIVQEGLTNVTKHAGPDVDAQVRVRHEPGGMTVDIHDQGATSGAPAGNDGGGGRGLIGMRERARSLGGTLTAGPDAGGGYRVRAWLPYDGGVR